MDVLQSFRREVDTADNLLDAYLGWRRALLRIQRLTYFDFELGLPVLERFGVSQHDLLDPQHNLEAALRYLSWLANRYDSDLTLVLAAFNSGEGTVTRFNGVPPYRETREYLRRIFTDLGVEPAPSAAQTAQ